MAGIVEGLFGPTPQQIQEQRQQQLMQDAAAYGRSDPMAAARSGYYAAGAQLAGAFGGEDPRITRAKEQQQLAASIDPTDPQSLMNAAQRVTDPQMRMKLMLAAKQRQAEIDAAKLEAGKAALAEKKQAFQENEGMQLKRDQLAQQFEIARMRSEDMRLAASDRANAARDANQIRLEIARMGMEMRSSSAADKAIEKADKERTSKAEAAASTVESFNSIERNINKLYDPEKKTLKPEATSIFGRVDQYRGPLALGEKSADALTALNSLRDQLTMFNLADAKKRVGQSFGSMQVKEWDKFLQQLSSLDRSMSENEAKENLKYITDFISNKKEILSTALGGGSTPAASSPPSNKPKVWDSATGTWR